MTVNKIRDSKIIEGFIFALLFLCVFFARETADSVRAGLLLCYKTVIPSLLPSMILTDILSSYYRSDGKTGIITRGISAVLGCNTVGPYIYVMGMLCGTPVGIREVCRSYENETITKEEAEHLMTFTSNAGAAFVIAGVGAGMRGSIRDGVILFLIQLFASFLCAVIFRPKSRHTSNKPIVNLTHTSFPEAISKCAIQISVICVCICFFSVICELVSMVFSGVVLAMLSSVLEMTCGIREICSVSLPYSVSMCMTAGAIGFGGISILFQSMHFTSGIGLSIASYIKGKVLCSALSIIICAIFCLFFR